MSSISSSAASIELEGLLQWNYPKDQGPLTQERFCQYAALEEIVEEERQILQKLAEERVAFLETYPPKAEEGEQFWEVCALRKLYEGGMGNRDMMTRILGAAAQLREQRSAFPVKEIDFYGQENVPPSEIQMVSSLVPFHFAAKNVFEEPSYQRDDGLGRLRQEEAEEESLIPARPYGIQIEGSDSLSPSEKSYSFDDDDDIDDLLLDNSIDDL